MATIGVAFVLAVAATAQEKPRRLITRCWQDILRFDMGEGTIQRVVPGEDNLSVRFDPAQGRFSVLRGARNIFTFLVEDLSSNAEILWSPDGRAFALNYSSGGAIGNFHVRLFVKRGDTLTEVSGAIHPALDDFKTRHYCDTRGNNITALKWVQGSRRLVLMTEVYATGDCGPDLGHAEAYVVTVPDGRIERHLTLNQLKNLPGICLENDDGR